MSLYLTALTAAIAGFEFIWSYRNPFPPIPTSATTLSFLPIWFDSWTHLRIQQVLGEKEPRGAFRQTALFLLLGILLAPAWLKKDYVYFHPIDMLIYHARIHHEKYLQNLGSTASLAETVVRYKQKYHRNPPPAFDIWFEYVKNRSALIVDELDQIYDDLLPFRSTPTGRSTETDLGNGIESVERDIRHHNPQWKCGST